MHPLKSKYTALRTQDGDSFFFLGFLLLPFLSISHTPRDKPLPLPSELTRCSQHLSIIFSWRKYTCIVYVFSCCHGVNSSLPSFPSECPSLPPSLVHPILSHPVPPGESSCMRKKNQEGIRKKCQVSLRVRYKL